MPQQITFMSTEKKGIKYELEEITLRKNELLTSEAEDQYVDNFLNGVGGVKYQITDMKNLIYEVQCFFTPSVIENFFDVVKSSRMSYKIIVFETEQDRRDYLEKINGKSLNDQVALFKKHIPFGSKNPNYKQNRNEN